LFDFVSKKNNFTKKRARYFSQPKNDEIKLKEFLEKRDQYLKENRIFISIDETSFGRNYVPAIGYSKKGTRLYVKRPFTRITTQSVVSAVSIGNPILYSKKEGSFNSDSFSEFISSLSFPEKSVLLMDNVSFHHSYKVKEVALKNKWDVLFVPPYSPIFNPIEGVFSIVKRHFQKFLIIDDAFKSVTLDNIKSFFKYSFNATSRF
jgi:transposase